MADHDGAVEAGEAPAAESAPPLPKSSRICVKELPKYVDEQRLREHFSLKGEVTDAKVMRTRDGKSRCFGFVGFRTVEEAQEAQRYFNKSFMDTMRLVVEFAFKYGSTEVPRAWSKYTTGTSANRRLDKPTPTGGNTVPLGEGVGAAEAGAGDQAEDRKKKKRKEREPRLEEDPTLQEFLHLMQPRAKQAIWTNDDLMPDGRPGARHPPGGIAGAGAGAGTAGGRAGAKARSGSREAGEDLALEDEEGESDEEYQELPAAVAGGAGGRGRGRGRGGSGGGGSDSEGSGDEGSEEEEGQPTDVVVQNAAVSDLDYLKSRVRRNFDDEGEEEEEEDVDSEAEEVEEEAAGGSSGSSGDEGLSGSEEEGEESPQPESNAEEATTTAGGSSSEPEEGIAGRKRPAAAGGPGQGSKQQHQAAAALTGSSRRKRGQSGDAADDELDGIFAGAKAPGRRRGGGAAGSGSEGSEEEGAGSGEEEEEGEEAMEADGSGEDGSEPGGEGEEDAEEEDEGGEEGEDGPQWQQQQQLQGQGHPGRGGGGVEAVEAGSEESIADTGRLFVRNLPYTATEADLRQLFEAQGEVAEVHLVLDRATKKSKGFALVQFAAPEDAVKAHAELDASIFMGRLLHILPGKRPPPPPEAAQLLEGGEDAEDGSGRAGTAGGSSSFKAAKEQQLKAAAGSNRAAWNTLFMRADTVAEAVAAHYGVAKSDLLDREAGDMAVRMALGEAHVIAATKAALGQAGADVAKLEEAAAAAGRASSIRAVPRGDTVLLVKNLPFTATLGDLETLFGASGALGRVVLPPTKTLALVEFLEPQDARKAFKSLAYKRFHHVPLYLEWAPKGIFSGPPPKPRPAGAAAASAATAPAAAAAEPAKASKAAGKGPSEGVTGLAEAQAADADVESSTVYVKNLPFASDEAALRQHFEEAVAAAGGCIRAVKVAKRKGADGKVLSAGFGFVECSSEDSARGVIQALQSSSLGGHRLVLQLSQQAAGGRGKAGAAAGGKQAGRQAKLQAPDTTKLVVRNVAFEATRKDIMGLFTPFGHVKSCRLPRKFDGTHRGFAFVDFATKQEARNALEAVAGTHLYGRRLVLEWAEEEGGLDELRAKTAAKYRGGEVEEPRAQQTRGLEAKQPPPKKRRK